MNQKSLFLKIAFGLVLFTCFGHTMGTFMKIPPEQVAVANAQMVLENTMVPLPMGFQKSFADIFLGNNISVSVYLLITGIIFLVISGAKQFDPIVKKLLLINSFGMAMLSVISILYFFPLPAICTGLAAVFGFVSAFLPEK
ncbi:LIC_13387 family protein [Leptospira bouyouniensis]|uniref:Uncharacterized protein n=1 Tax=Leptospira bouyouniensis TaxID=2484911 RepID=A0ABY2L513_9LEPT|nr:hypothetical protein [Leptospira bouyouniensis]TGK49503.1 hypothetical protein EHQ10_08575 [Leptospira bouyouniensis]